jgi:predicted nucleotidyltransferase component of viral defense system
LKKPPPSNLPASVRQRLLNLSYKNHEDYNLILTRYAAERFLYRLSQSEYARNFVLKGSLLFAVWTGTMHRPTRDVDLLGYGNIDREIVAATFRSICLTPVEADGIDFDSESVQIEEIRENQEYGGWRVLIEARLETAKVRMQVDIGIGDAISPEPEIIQYPTLLLFPAPHMRAYPKETVIAEKVDAMLVKGPYNSRIKDFYDVWILSRTFAFKGETLLHAIISTLQRRRTEILQSIPISLTLEWWQTNEKKNQWNAFLSREKLAETGVDSIDMIQDLRRFLLPILSVLSQPDKWTSEWPAGGPWSNRISTGE